MANWQLIVNQKLNQNYVGPAEKCYYHFSLWPEQIPGVRLVAQQIVDAHVEELAEENSQLLELRVWEDTSPTWETKYKVEVVATASPLFWNVIIIGVLALLIVLGVFFVIDKVEDVTEYIGEVAPGAIPVMAIAAVGLLVVVGIALTRSKQ